MDEDVAYLKDLFAEEQRGKQLDREVASGSEGCRAQGWGPAAGSL